MASVEQVDVDVRDAGPAEALAFLTRLEADSGVPPVDEDEQRRLAGHAPVRDPGWGWTAHLVDLAGAPAAYAGIRMPAGQDRTDPSVDCAARVDLAIDRARPEAHQALAAALAHLRSHAGPPTTAVEAWLRGATAEDLATAAQAGFREQGRLHVLGADAAALARHAPASIEAVALPDGVRLRPFAPGDAAGDDDAVVRLLMRAYPERARAYADGFAPLRSAGWFRAEDLLLLEATVPDGGLLALHWMKRRGEGVGEVYNLAVDPDAQGRGFGPLLLDAGLAHLVAVGSREVVLWVDAANPRALELYRSRGFTPRWDDVSLAG